MIDDAIVTLAETISQQQCVLFLGNDFLEAKYSQFNNKSLLERLKQTRNYIASDSSYFEAIKIKSIVEGVSSVIDFIRENSKRINDNLADVYSEIAKLPFGSIISTSLDSHLENLLISSNIPHHVLVEDVDVYMNNNLSLPIIKLFGSISQGKIRISLDEIRDVFKDNSLLGQYIKVLCANRTLLFAGFQLDDRDFFNLFNLINRELGSHRGLTFVVVDKPRQFDIDLWSRQHVRVIPSGTIDLLQKINIHLLLSKSSPSASEKMDDKIWIDNPFFRPLFYVRTLPSVNQVVDGILSIVMQILENESDENLRETGERIVNSIDQISQFRPNYAPLRKLTQQIEYLLPPHKNTTVDELRIEIGKIISTRRQARNILGEKGSRILSPTDRILLYSQSTCVNSVIKAWLDNNKGKTKKAEIVLPEIRPKSPLPFQDALATVQAITDSVIPITLIPDASIAHIFQAGKIDKVLMGVDKIFEDHDNGDSRFVVTNVTGTLNIVIIANNMGVPVYFVAEEDKLYQKNLSREFTTQYKPEEKIVSNAKYNIFPDNDSYNKLIQSDQLTFFNPGYDEIDSRSHSFIILTEKREIHLDAKKKE
jgi:translation initiation factor 2B subunit (eIF-2B alpha/beta/delta family)